MSEDYVLDFTTVFFGGDAVLLKLQARSMRLFLDPGMIGRIHVINNDTDAAAAGALFAREILPEYGALRSRVVLHDAGDLIGRGHLADGWRTQQALKLRIAGRIATARYVTLDAKNHFLRLLTASDLLDGARARSFWARPSGNQPDYLTHSLRYMGQDPTAWIERAMPVATPYVLYTDIVNRMVADIEARERVSFEEVFLQRHRRVTEYYLYFGWLLRAGIDPETLYAFGKRTTVTMFTRWPEQEADITRVLGKLAHPQTKIFGLHRRRMAGLSDAHRATVAAAWREAGLVTDPAEVSRIFAAPE